MSGRTRGWTVMRTVVVLTSVVLAIDLVSTAILVGYVGWWFALGEALLSGLFGLAVVGYLFWQHRKVYARSPSTELQWNGVLLLMAAAMLILPGIVSDAIGLLLLVPPLRKAFVRWIVARVS